MKKYYGGIELGGTKIICVLGDSENNIVESVTFKTTTPDENLPQIRQFFKSYSPLNGLGIGTFGPVNIDKSSKHFGCILKTNKKHWAGTNLYQYFSQHLKCDIKLTTDVNAAAIAEHRCGAAQGLNNFIYITIGTGIGASAMINGAFVQGNFHPEMGHCILPLHKDDINFKSVCKFHESCVEGLASGKAIVNRWGDKLEDLDKSHPAWALQAHYLSLFLNNLIMLYSPEKIIIGGGVTNEFLLSITRDLLFKVQNGYIEALTHNDDLIDYITLSEIQGGAGPKGALILVN